MDTAGTQKEIISISSQWAIAESQRRFAVAPQQS
jgi:hypothetical protein